VCRRRRVSAFLFVLAHWTTKKWLIPSWPGRLKMWARRRNGGAGWAGAPPTGPDPNLSLWLRPSDDGIRILTRLDCGLAI
jgi:hypothetical protein